MRKLIFSLPILALAACQTTGSATQDTQPQTAAAGSSQTSVSADAAFDHGVKFCIGYLQSGTPIETLSNVGFRKSLDAWSTKPFLASSSFEDPKVYVTTVRGDECFVTITPKTRNEMVSYFARAERVLSAQGYRKEVRTFRKGRKFTYFIKGTNEISLQASTSGTIVSVHLAN
ncbi:hypothetical protein VWY34_12935 [Phaeobacter sp. JH20_02]|uniref:hypothetical protein n=1 Tax=unclassified Phaeobacter TaxID=2621772 RepID=UPI003A8BA90D